MGKSSLQKIKQQAMHSGPYSYKELLSHHGSAVVVPSMGASSSKKKLPKADWITTKYLEYTQLHNMLTYYGSAYFIVGGLQCSIKVKDVIKLTAKHMLVHDEDENEVRLPRKQMMAYLNNGVWTVRVEREVAEANPSLEWR